MIARLGKEINNPESVYYWAQKVRDWRGKDARLWHVLLFTATWIVGTSLLIPAST